MMQEIAAKRKTQAAEIAFFFTTHSEALYIFSSLPNIYTFNKFYNSMPKKNLKLNEYIQNIRFPRTILYSLAKIFRNIFIT